jgi:hypothetical protein
MGKQRKKCGDELVRLNTPPLHYGLLRYLLSGFLTVFAALVLAGCGFTQGSTTKPATTNQGQLTANPSSLTFGNVNIGASNQQNVILTNSESVGINISQVNVSGAGLSTSGLTAPMTLSAGQSTILTVIYAPTSASSTNGSVSVVSNAVNSPTTITVSGTGVQGHSVALSWNASTSSVAGYNVYRWTGTQSAQPTILNSSLVAATSFTDFTVVSGQTYIYATTAVDSSGVESAFSNTVTVSIP